MDSIVLLPIPKRIATGILRLLLLLLLIEHLVEELELGECGKDEEEGCKEDG